MEKKTTILCKNRNGHNAMSLPTPYYDEGGITIYHADCREILPHLPKEWVLLVWEPSTLKSNHARFIRRWRFNKNEVT